MRRDGGELISKTKAKAKAKAKVKAEAKAGLSLNLGPMSGLIEFKPEQLKAWRRFARGEVDKVTDKGD